MNSVNSNNQTLKWEHFNKEVPSSLFGIWSAGGGIEWAKSVWDFFNKKELTHYKTEKEKQLVYLRLMILSQIYNLFCEIRFEEKYENDFSYLEEELKSLIQDFDFGLLESGNDEVFSGVYTKERKIVSDALLEMYLPIKSNLEYDSEESVEENLYKAMYNTTTETHQFKIDNFFSDNPSVIPYEDWALKLEVDAISWIRDGMQDNW